MKSPHQISASHSMLVVLLFFTCIITHAAGALMAIDLGSEFLKISIVKPGRIPISIVNNEMSKRKSPAAVAFVNGDRLVGDEAAALSVRYPDRVFTRVRDLLGRNYDDPAVQRLVKESRLAYKIVPAPNRTTVALQVDDKETYTAEEIVASLFEYAKRLATTAAEAPVTDAVLVVPPFWSPAQRQALVDAAELAGLNVLSLIHTHAAAALQYGIERDFTNKVEDVIFYDVGAGAAQAALVRFSAFGGSGGSGSGSTGTGKGGSQAAISQFEVKDMAWVEHGVGCEVLETALLEHFAKQVGGNGEGEAEGEKEGAVLASPRAVAKLRKQVKRTKEVLSANSDAPVIVDELLSGQDFRGKISREEFEELVSGVWDRTAAPLRELLQRNQIAPDTLSAVELLGGCSRVPRIKAALMSVLGGRTLDMHLDADEAVVLGAGLYAANLSTIFRLRKFGMTDKTSYTVKFALEGAEEAEEEESGGEGGDGERKEARVLVPILRKIPTKRAIALHNLTVDGFSVSLAMDNARGAVLPCCVRQEPLGTFHVSGISSVVEKYGHSGKVAVHTVVDASGMFAVDKADAAVEVEEEVKVKVPAPPAKSSKKDDNSTSTSDSDDNGDGKEGGSGGNETARAEKAKGGKKAEEEEEQEQYVTKMWKHTKRIPLNITGGMVQPGLTAEQKRASRKVLRGLRERDEAKRATAKARNDLEAYIIGAREKLESNEDLVAASTEEERDTIKGALMDAEDWLYGDGDAATAPELQAKLKAVRKGGDAIEERAREALIRPRAVQSATDFIELALKSINAWGEMKPWLNQTEVQELKEAVKGLQEWMTEVVAAQEGKSGHETPAFKVQEMALKVEPLKKNFHKLNSKRKPLEKKKVPEVVNATMADGNANGTAAANETVEATASTPVPTEDEGGEASGGVNGEDGQGDDGSHDEL